MANVGNLEDAARKRKARLKGLRGVKPQDGDDTEEGERRNKVFLQEEEKLPTPVFRSYKPTDESLKEAVLPKAKPIEVASGVEDMLEQTKSAPVNEIDLTTLAPRKPDWDLKRDVQKKLDKLERQTQRAIAELIRERLRDSSDDLAAAVNDTVAASQLED